MMKDMLRFAVVAVVALPFLYGCQKENPDDLDKEPVKPEVTFAMEGDSFEAMLNVPFELKAEIITEGPVECTWSVDGEVIAGTPTTTYIFTEKRTYNVAFSAFNDAGRVDKVFTATVVGEKLVVEFDRPENEVITIREGENVTITATIIAGDKDTVHEWKVGDEIKGSDVRFEHTFALPGTYAVNYKGTNADDETVTASWTVNVKAKALSMEYSISEGSTIDRKQGEPVFITASAKTGSDGLTHEWKVNDDIVGTEEQFGYLFTETGTATITYNGQNSLGEKAAGTWTVNVETREVLFTEHFEDDDIGKRPVKGNEYIWLNSNHGIATNNDNGKNGDGSLLMAIGIEANGTSSAINGSAHVLANDMSKSGSTGTSGVFNYRFPNYTGKDDVTAVRMKIWYGPGNYYPWLVYSIKGEPRSLPSKVNGQPFDPKNGTKEQFDALMVKNEWNVIEYDIKQCYGASSLSGCEQIMPRPFMDFNGTNSSGKADPATNSRVSYFDDIEFLK